VPRLLLALGPVDATDLITLLRPLLDQRARARHRQLLLLTGRPGWCRDTAAAVLGALPAAATLWIGADAPLGEPCRDRNQLRARLGGEYPRVVLDAWAGLDPDGLGMAGGLVPGGGLLVLLAPPLADWPAWDEPHFRRHRAWQPAGAGGPRRFLGRLARLLAADGQCLHWDETAGCRHRPRPEAAPAPETATVAPPCRSADQARAVAAVRRVAEGHRDRPLVLTADRGRGKSTALGLAAADLLAARPRRILVTGPSPAAVQAVFDGARRALPAARRDGACLRLGGGALCFLPPDRLAQAAPPADLLLVDEAAALPVPLLERLLRRYHRVVFATTEHGYEGSGRGFALRFRQRLDALRPGWRRLTLAAPIRWAAGDPLEASLRRLLLLDAEPWPAEALPDAPPCWQRLARDRLAGDEALLRQVFGLLVLAHYQTRPGDLRDLLDAPGWSVWVGRQGGAVVAVAVLAEEGPLPPALGAAVARGERRLRGHLLPQALAVQAGRPEAAGLRHGRIVRIAVHPARQRQGLGTALLARLCAFGRAAGLDTLGASFGASAELVPFWRGAGFNPVELGTRRDAASGHHGLIVLQGLTAAGRALQAALARRLWRRLPRLLAEPLQRLEPAVLCALAPAPPAARVAPDGDDLADAEGYARARRPWEATMSGLTALVWWGLQRDGLAALPAAERALLVEKLLQGRPWAAVAAAHGLAGRRAVEARLRAALATLLATPQVQTLRHNARLPAPPVGSSARISGTLPSHHSQEPSMKAILKKSSAAEPFSFAFVTDDGKTLLRSENYKAKNSAMNGIESVKKNCGNDARYELKEAKNGKLFFNLKAANGQIVATSAMFPDAAARDAAIAELKKHCASAPVDDQT